MRVPEKQTFPLAIDDRGSLLALEFSLVPFPVRRVFSVTGPVGGAVRGQHIVPCSQLIVLTAGSAIVRVGADEHSLCDPVNLDEPGEAVTLIAGEYVWYRMADEHSTVLVLAEQAYSAGAS